jgi:hypothetical protein
MMMERSFLPNGHHQLSEAEAAVGNWDCANALRFSVRMLRVRSLRCENVRTSAGPEVEAARSPELDPL